MLWCHSCRIASWPWQERGPETNFRQLTLLLGDRRRRDLLLFPLRVLLSGLRNLCLCCSYSTVRGRQHHTSCRNDQKQSAGTLEKGFWHPPFHLLMGSQGTDNKALSSYFWKLSSIFSCLGAFSECRDSKLFLSLFVSMIFCESLGPSGLLAEVWGMGDYTVVIWASLAHCDLNMPGKSGQQGTCSLKEQHS